MKQFYIKKKLTSHYLKDTMVSPTWVSLLVSELLLQKLIVIQKQQVSPQPPSIPCLCVKILKQQTDTPLTTLLYRIQVLIEYQTYQDIFEKLKCWQFF